MLWMTRCVGVTMCDLRSAGASISGMLSCASTANERRGLETRSINPMEGDDYHCIYQSSPTPYRYFDPMLRTNTRILARFQGPPVTPRSDNLT